MIHCPQPDHARRELELFGQKVVVIGGSAGIGLETARRANAAGADVILTGRNPDRLEQASRGLDALSTASFDAADPASLAPFFDGLPAPIDHVMVTAGGSYYARLVDMDFARARRSFDEHLWLMLDVARHAAEKVRPGGSLIFMSGTGARHSAPGLVISAALAAALPRVTANLALELAPVRVNLIAAGFVDTPLSASLLGQGVQARRDQLRDALPVGRVIEAGDVAALAVHVMANTALTGATYDVDGGEQLLPGADG
jgi:NAD(P)-dependent dehydrogenase (short-subunit alcohol dehydrogenase family)